MLLKDYTKIQNNESKKNLRRRYAFPSLLCQLADPTLLRPALTPVEISVNKKKISAIVGKTRNF